MKAFVFLLCFVTFQVFAQESSVTAINPASLKWYQIKTPHFKLLYPEGFEAQAQRMANTLETIREPEAKSLMTNFVIRNGKPDSLIGIKKLPHRISIVLQNQSSISNAFVSAAPRRAEFYTMPSQNYNFTGTNDWLNLLASHEYRHIVQFQHAKRGFSRAAYYLGGANTYAVLAYVAAPQWFWEGDAVATETAFTESGRGRIPNFNLLLRTNLLEGRTFNYHKQYLRSYKNNINDHYVLGFHMVSHLRKKTNDPLIWDKVTRTAWNFPFIPFWFAASLKINSGFSASGLYKDMAASLQKDWRAQLDTLKLTSFDQVNSRHTSTYTDYMYPQELEDGSILVRKSGIGDIEKLVALSGDGEERILFTQGIINETGMLSATNRRIVWNEYRFDPRWQVRTYSTIVGYDFGSNVKQVISPHGRYAGAAISPNGYQVATVETTSEYATHLVVLDYFNKGVLKSFENLNNDFISMPRWTTDGKAIAALLTNKNGKAIAKFNTEDGAITMLTEFSKENIGHPVPFGDYILYNSPISGIDNIYALDIKTGERYQITCAKYGAYNPMVTKDGKWIYYNNQGRDGMDVAKIAFEPSIWRPWKGTLHLNAGVDHLVNQEGNPTVFNNIPTQQYDTKRYHRWKGIVNPHSWGLTFGTSFLNPQNPIGIYSQDVLSTTQLFAGFVYDRSENTWTKKATVSYQGWYPIIDFSITDGDRKVNEGEITVDKYNGTKPNYILTRTTPDVVLSWHERNIEGGLRLPLNTTSSKYFGNITFANNVGVSQVSNFSNNITSSRIIPTLYYNDTVRTDDTHGLYFFQDRLSNGYLVYNQFSISAYRLLKQSRRDINSKLGQAFYMNLYNTPYGGDYTGTQFSFYGLLYLPGLAKHHSLWGYWGYQNSQMDFVTRASNKKDVADNYIYQFRNQIPLPRGGLGVSRFESFYSMSANYTMPVWYPDIAAGPVLNIQRIRANGFLDYGFGSTPKFGVSQSYLSVGVEVKFDINVMRLLPQLDLGFRYSKGLTPATSLFEILIGSINF